MRLLLVLVVKTTLPSSRLRAYRDRSHTLGKRGDRELLSRSLSKLLQLELLPCSEFFSCLDVLKRLCVLDVPSYNIVFKFYVCQMSVRQPDGITALQTAFYSSLSICAFIASRMLRLLSSSPTTSASSACASRASNSSSLISLNDASISGLHSPSSCTRL